MKLTAIILGLIASILAIILAILPMEKIAIIPAIAAFIFGLIAFFLSKNESKKIIKLIFLATIIAFVLIIYKSVFLEEKKVVEDQNFIESSKEAEKEAIEDLEDIEIEIDSTSN